MGGIGSGRFEGKKNAVSGFKKIDIAYIKKENLQPGKILEIICSKNGQEIGGMIMEFHKDHVDLYHIYYDPDTAKKEIKQTIMLDYTRPYFGGKRYWFLCPGCGIRRRILYGVSKYFKCRECYDLTYETCQTKNKFDILNNKLNKIYKKLGANKAKDRFGRFLMIPDKPANMHWETYSKLALEARDLRDRYVEAMQTSLREKFPGIGIEKYKKLKKEEV